MHVVGGGRVEGRGDSGDGAIAIAVAEGRFFRVFSGGGFEFEPWCEAGKQAAKGFEVSAYGAGLGLARCGFDGHLAAQSAFFEGLEDRVGDELYLLEPVVALLLCCWDAVGGVDFGREGGSGSCSEGAQEEGAAIRARCFACRHVSPSSACCSLRANDLYSIVY